MVHRLGLLLAILGVACAAGAFNYHRNFTREAREPRPFRSYAAADLEVLAQAYEREVAELRARYDAERQDVGHGVRGGQLMDENVRAYEQASARGLAVRGLGGALSMKEAALADVREEQARRREPPHAAHLRRLLTF